MSDRHPKWQRVEPGTVIPAGQPYRLEWPKRGTHPDDLLASERVCYHHDMRAFAGTDWFTDSTWSPPLELPTEPTWGIAIHEDGSQWLSKWTAHRTALVTMLGPSYAWSERSVLDFIPLTPEQVARIEAAR